MERETEFHQNETLIETALRLQKEIIKSTQNAQMGYIPNNIDVVAVLGHKSTFLNARLHDTEDWERFMDNDRVTRAAYLWHQVSIHQTKKTDPLFVYAGSIQECNVISNCNQQEILGIPKDKLHIVHEVEQRNYKKSHTNTSDNIEAVFQNLTSEESTLSRKTNVVIVSNLGHFIRIPFYLEHYRIAYDPDSKIKFYPYAVPERPEARKPFMESEQRKLCEYLKLGYLSPQPAQFKYFEPN